MMTMLTFWIALAAAFLWLLGVAPTDSNPWWRSWLVDVFRIVFAAATLVTLLSMAGRPVF